MKNDQLIVTVPTYATVSAQKALLDACSIAGIEARIVDESTATMYNFAYEKMSELRSIGSPRIVAFVDIGHSKTTVTIVEYTKEIKAKIILSKSDVNLGGRDLDWEILKIIADEF